MKVTLPDNYKMWMTVDDVERARCIIKAEREDCETAKGWAEYAVREALKGSDEYLRNVLDASAEIAANSRVWDAWEGGGKFDVLIEATARTTDGFIIVGAFLSDIWQSGAVPYKEHMYIRRFKEVQ